jgi:hypothetical protein
MASHWPASFYHLICTGFDPRLVIAATPATLLPRARAESNFFSSIPGDSGPSVCAFPEVARLARPRAPRCANQQGAVGCTLVWSWLPPFVLCGAASVHRAMHALFGAPVQWNVRNTAETLHFIELPTNRSCPSYGRATARCA